MHLWAYKLSSRSTLSGSTELTYEGHPVFCLYNGGLYTSTKLAFVLNFPERGHTLPNPLLLIRSRLPTLIPAGEVEQQLEVEDDFAALGLIHEFRDGIGKFPLNGRQHAPDWVLEHLELHEVLIILRRQEMECMKVVEDILRDVGAVMGNLGGDGNDELEGLASGLAGVSIDAKMVNEEDMERRRTEIIDRVVGFDREVRREEEARLARARNEERLDRAVREYYYAFLLRPKELD